MSALHNDPQKEDQSKDYEQKGTKKLRVVVSQEKMDDACTQQIFGVLS